MPLNVFGAGAVQTAYVAYRAFVLNQNTTLFWPNAYQDTNNTVAAYMEVVNVSSPNLVLKLPDATQVSVGQNFIIYNSNGTAFTLNNASSGNIGVISPGVAYYYILRNNNSAAGVWERIVFGAGVSEASAFQLAGLGLIANQGKLDTNVKVTTVPPTSAFYQVSSTDNASIIIWNGGAGDLYLPNIENVLDGFYFSFNNAVQGAVTIRGDANIDQDPTFVVSQGQSLTLIKASDAWWTLGYGQQVPYLVTILNKDISGNSNVTLTENELNNSVIQFTGILTGNVVVYFPAQIGQWVINNKTTGNFTLNVQIVGALGTSYRIPQNTTQSLYSTGGTLVAYPTALNNIMPSNPTTGAMIYFNGTNWVLLPPGTANQVLKIIGGVPTWAD
jgi:hypothetical protein